MQTINLSKSKATSLEALPLDYTIFNTEGKLFRIKYLNKDLVLKSLYNNSGFIFANKLYTIEMLDTYKHSLPRSFCVPNYLVTINKNVEGFAMPYIEGENFATVTANNNISLEEKLYYYKKIGDILNQLKSIRRYTSLKDFYINDLHEGNIIVNPNNREVSFIDLDSCKVGSNCAFSSKYLNNGELLENKPYKYKYNTDNNAPGYLIANENSDIYCYIIMLLNFLLDDDLWRINETELLEFLNYLDIIGVNKELLYSIETITKKDKNNKNPRDYLETLTLKQIVKARRYYSKK